MNTYLFYPPPFKRTFKVLTNKHLVQQVYRAIQVYEQILRRQDSPWRNLPIVLQWEQHPRALCKYIYEGAREARSRGLSLDSVVEEYHERMGTKVVFPLWCKDPKVHQTSRANIKDSCPLNYGDLWPEIPASRYKYHPVPFRLARIKIKKSKRIRLKSIKPLTDEEVGKLDAINLERDIQYIENLLQTLNESQGKS